jgi:AcrR family transcriptional regulator
MKDGSATGDRGRSIWLRSARSGRGPVSEHSAAEIAQAAITLADAEGLGAVTMRAVAAAIGTAPASLYRYVNSRGELLELMADQAGGEYSFGEPASGQPVTDLLALGQQTLSIYRRHPWLLDIPPAGGLPGPNALAYIEHVLAILSVTGLNGPAKLELIGLYTGAIRSFAQVEAEQRRVGRDTAEWQQSVAGYLIRIAAGGQHPHLAAALADQPAQASPAQHELVFDRALTRILTSLLPPPDRPAPASR